MRRRYTAILSITLAIAAVLTGPAPSTRAQQAAPGKTPAETAAPSPQLQAARASCAADVAKFCGAMKKGKGVIRACLDAHAAELSAGCTAARKELQKAREAAQSTAGKSAR